VEYATAYKQNGIPNHEPLPKGVVVLAQVVAALVEYVHSGVVAVVSTQDTSSTLFTHGYNIFK
jgi:hypothetical protein